MAMEPVRTVKSRVSGNSQMDASKGDRLGEILLARGLIGPAELEAALDWQRSLAGEWPVRRLGSLLIKAGVLTGSQVADALVVQHGGHTADPLPRHIDPALRDLFPLDLLIRLQAVPLHLHGNTLAVAMADPHNSDHVRALCMRCDYLIEPIQGPQLQIYRLLRELAEGPQWTVPQALPELRLTRDLVPPPRLERARGAQVPKVEPAAAPAPQPAPREPGVQFGPWLVALGVALVALASIGLGLRLQDRNLGRDAVSWVTR